MKQWFYVRVYADVLMSGCHVKTTLLHFLNSNSLQPGDFQVVRHEGHVSSSVPFFDVLYFAEKELVVEYRLPKS